MADEIRAVQPSARLYLVTAELFQHPDLQELIRPNLPRIGQSDDLLLQVGLDASTLARDERMVLLRSQRIAPPDPLVAQGINLELNLDADLDAKLHSLAHPGVLFHHERQETALESFDARSPFRRSYTRLVTVASPSAEQNQRRFIQALAAQDCQACFDGGWLLPLGQEAALADLFAIYRQLPAASFQTVEGKTQPVTIRTLEGDHRSYVYLVNDSPWRVSVNLTTTAAGQFRMQQLGGSRRVFSLHGDGTQRVCNVDLGPYELAAAAFDGRVRVSNAKVNLPALLADQLDARIRDLWNRAASLKNAAPISGVANADFEQAARRDAVPPGWELKPIKGAIATVDNRHAHGGTQSVRMTADAAGAEMRTAPLMIPKTGRLSISVWMRTADPQRQPTLRLGVEGTGVNPYVRYATVGAAPGGQPLADTWGQFVLPIHDLPTDLGQQLHVKFELVGAGEVWIDDVQLFDLDFSEEERLELSKSLTLIEYKRESGEYRDCLRLLDGYWPRFLTTFVPAVEQPLVRRPAKPEASPAAAEPEPRTGLMDRLRRSLPEFMR
jgi:hypothetical protein